MTARSLLQQRRLVALAGAFTFAFIIVTTLCSPTARLYLTGKPSGLRPSPVAIQDPVQSPLPPLPPLPPAAPADRTPSWDLRIPNDYFDKNPSSKFCAERFSTKYLENLRNNSAIYCNPEKAQSSLTCFHSHTSPDGPDSFCVARGVALDSKKHRFGIHCPLRTLSSEEKAGGVVPFESIRGYWYGTGPAEIFGKFITFLKRPPPLVPSTKREETNQTTVDGNVIASPPRNFLLIKREGDGNPWHCLLEIWSAWMTMDVLRISMDPGRNEPYFAHSEDEEDTQVVILDDLNEGPYYGMWSLFSKHDAVRLGDLSTPIPSSANVIIPLAGASNPIWQNDWGVRDCTSAATLSAFSRRVLRMHGLDPDKAQQRGPQANISVVFVDRSRYRKLVNQTALFEALEARVPHVSVSLVDFAALSFRDQVREARNADVLVGVHGAGLTHAMWMHDGAGSVVEIQPSELNHNGFRNLALMKGLGFYRVHANSTESPKKKKPARAASLVIGGGDETGPGDHALLQRRDRWHWEDVILEEERFLEVMTVAIKSLYAKGSLNYDVN